MMMRRLAVLVLLLAVYSRGWGDEPTVLGAVEVVGTVHQPEELSAVGAVGEVVLIAADEMIDEDNDARNVVQVLKQLSANRYGTAGEVTLLENEELDIEGIACDGRTVYVIGSHAYTRRSVDAGNTYEQNLRRLQEVRDEGKRDRVFRFELTAGGEGRSLKEINLRRLIEQDPVLGRFAEVPSKENGVDIEGIAVANGRLFLGFRGPVLRDRYVPVMVAEFESEGEYELRFVQLDGGGIRDITAVSDGFLIISGPVGDAAGPYRVWFWDGRCCLPGRDRPLGAMRQLGKVPLPPDENDVAKPEGIAVIDEDAENWDAFVVYDSAGSGLMRIRIPRPQ